MLPNEAVPLTIVASGSRVEIVADTAGAEDRPRFSIVSVMSIVSPGSAKPLPLPPSLSSISLPAITSQTGGAVGPSVVYLMA